MNVPFVCHRCCRRFLTRLPGRRSYSIPVLAERAESQDEERIKKAFGSFGALGWVETSRTRTKAGERTYNDRLGQQQEARKEDKALESLFDSGRTQVKEPRGEKLEERSKMQTKSTRKQEDRSTARYSRTPLAKSSKPSTGYQVAKDEEKRRDSQRSLESGSDDDKACDAMMDELSKLNSLRKKNKLPFETIWTSVLGIIESETWRQLAASKNLKEHKGDRIFLGVLLEIAKRGYIMVDEKKITAKDVIIIYRKHAAFKPWWPVILWMQLRSLVETPTLGLSTPPTQVAFAEKLSGLIKIWALYFESYRSKSSYWDRYMSGTGQIFEQEIERVSEAGLKPVEVSEEFENLPLALGARFGQLFGFGKNKPRFQPIALVAIFSLHFLELHMDKLENDQVILDAALTLRNSFRILEKNSAWDYESVRHHLRGVGTSRQDLEAAKAEWLGLSAQGSRNSPMSNVARRSPRVYFWTGHNIDRWFARANRLSSTEPPGIKDVIRFWHFSKDKLEKEQLEDPEIRDKIFARLFKLFFEVNRNDEAIEVWNYMLSSGVRPTKIHWTAMLAGCGRVRDLESMQGIWSNMLNSKFEPDNETWTAYIHGIVRAGQSQQGLALLEQLSHDWRSKIKSIQPSLGPVHGAMSAIHTLNRGRNSIIDFHKLVLNWARSQGLQPETFTYNIMLKTINLSATTDELQSHLKAMAEDNCKPDIITYTLILKGLVGSYKSPFFSLSEKDQVAAINSVLQSLSTNNMYPSPHTYSTLLFGLLDSREHPPSISAARLVLSHMDTANIEASAHIHTILLTHYFKGIPPDIPSIDAHIKLATRNPQRRKRLGPVFWNRVITGFAECDEWEKALQYLRHRPLENKNDGWMTLWKVLQALGRAKEWGLCDEVVEGVESGRLMKHGRMKADELGYRAFMGEVEDLRRQGLIEGKNGADEKSGSFSRGNFNRAL